MKSLANKRRRDNPATPSPVHEQDHSPETSVAEPLWDTHWEGLTEDDETDTEDEAADVDVPLQAILDDIEANEDSNLNALQKLAGKKDWSNIKGPMSSSGSRQQGPTTSERTDRRKRATAQIMSKEAQTIQPLSKWFGPKAVQAEVQPSSSEKRTLAIHDLKELLRKKNHGLQGQTLRRHELVLQLMHSTRSRTELETRKDMAFNIARGYGRGRYLSTMILKWERSWISHRKIEDDKRGRKNALRSWLNDEGTILAVREYIAQAGTSE